MGVFLNILATVGIVAQYLIEHIVKRKERKKTFGRVILVCTGIGIWGSYYIQQQTASELSSQLGEIKSSNIALQAKLSLRDGDILHVRVQNDSLRLQLAEVSKQQRETGTLSKKAAEEATRGREAIESLRFKTTARTISPEAESQMLRVLSSHKGGQVRITSVMGDQEAFQFASQLERVFTKAGWQVPGGLAQSVFSGPVVGIIVKVRSEQYPTRVNSIQQAFNVLTLRLEGILDNKLGPDDVELIIGGR